jgi:hypothetical protein
MPSSNHLMLRAPRGRVSKHTQQRCSRFPYGPTSRRKSVKLAIVSDAWRPQVNGVARTLAALQEGLTAAGHEAVPLTPNLFRTVPCPTDREVHLAIGARPGLARRLDALAPDAIHIATEGPLGHAARAYCISRDLRFTTPITRNTPNICGPVSASRRHGPTGPCVGFTGYRAWSWSPSREFDVN